jgi:drug/metabolite transporter (DMT)-like permease
VSAGQDHLPRHLWWLLAALTLGWGFNWTAIKVALSEVPPWTFRVLCLGLGATLLFVVLRLGGERRFSVPAGQWRRLMLLAFFNITCWNILVAFGTAMIPSGRAAILAYTMPALAVPLSVWVLGERLNGRKVTGLALGMGGIALLLGDGLAGLGGAPVGSLMVLGAAASWALGLVLQKRFPMAMPVGPYSVWMMLVGGVPILVCAALFEDPAVLRHVGTAPWLGVAYNVVIAFAFAYWAWIKLATSVSVTVFSLSMLVIPVVGVTSGMLFLGERPSAAEYGALALVIGSLLSVALPPRAARG